MATWPLDFIECCELFVATNCLKVPCLLPHISLDNPGCTKALGVTAITGSTCCFFGHQRHILTNSFATRSYSSCYSFGHIRWRWFPPSGALVPEPGRLCCVRQGLEVGRLQVVDNGIALTQRVDELELRG